MIIPNFVKIDRLFETLNRVERERERESKMEHAATW